MGTSAQIAAVRAAADGAISQLVMGALVTYVAPAIGADAAGVFVQGSVTSPALFLAVDPTALTPAPAPGQNVTFTVTTKATQDGQPRASAITGWAVTSSGNSLTALVQDLSSATDLLTALDSYDSELVIITGGITGAFAASAANHVAAELDTVGVSGNPALKLRLPRPCARRSTSPPRASSGSARPRCGASTPAPSRRPGSRATSP